MLKRPFVFFVLFFALSLAQDDAYMLPLSFQGDGTLRTVFFTTDSPWKVNISSTAIAVLYLYNSQDQKITTVLENEVVETTGTFYFVVNTEGVWQMSIENAAGVTTNAEAVNPTKTNTPISVDLPLKRYGYQITRYLRPMNSDLAGSKVCSDFATVFEAHDFFMAAGGPELDPYNLDPDGDGYICTYDPRESYAPPVNCEAGKQWQNPRFRVKDGLYAKGACR